MSGLENKAGRVIAILGAESTGKTTLADELCAALRAEGSSVVSVSEYLREFCEQAGRTPVLHEQPRIADEQTRRVAAAAQTHDLVIADTTALMTAVYSDLVFADRSLYAAAERVQSGYALTLVSALDLPWQPDALRDGPQVREPVDALLRAALARAGVAYSVVSGAGKNRVESALLAVRHALSATALNDETRANPRWQWMCERCGDADCERHLKLRR
ncbi:MAG TPA: ATP-binding protein [Rhizobacter sp.]|nr:ATP-binding protein [Rhizobacter sp.]